MERAAATQRNQSSKGLAGFGQRIKVRQGWRARPAIVLAFQEDVVG
jgi:hypothetical protein